MVVTILLFSILVSFIPDVNWHRGLAIFLGISYVLLWQAMLIQFLRKYYFKTHESFMRFLSKYFVQLLIFS